MQNEAAVRRTVVQNLKQLDAVSVENSVGSGTPDVNYIGGWLEIKNLHGFPTDPTKVVPVHLRPSQRAWLTKRRQMGGKAFVLIKVGKEWLLYDGMSAARSLGLVWNEEACRSGALLVYKKMDWAALARMIS